MERRLATLAVCTLHQWSLDFEGNLVRIQKSIDEARKHNATYRMGPELEITGYGCEDHFLEEDTIRHSWECVYRLMRDGYTNDLLCDVGMPVRYKGCVYNCRIVMLNCEILLIRPKISLANDDNYRETRYFTPWKENRLDLDFPLPELLHDICPSTVCPFGDAALVLKDSSIGFEICEEMYTVNAPSRKWILAGVEILSNGSGSLHEIQKINKRFDVLQFATRSWGGVYLHANQRGCDGGDLYYDGSGCIIQNGDFLSQGSQFGLDDVEVVTATVDLDLIQSKRKSHSFQEQSINQPQIHKIAVDFNLCRSDRALSTPSPIIEAKLHSPEEELVLGAACWLWDYLRRSGASGFLLPLSGGADSSATAAIVGAMCQHVVQMCLTGHKGVEFEARRIGRYASNETISDPKEFAYRIFTTMYQSTENSSVQTRHRAASLAEEIGSYHVNVNIDSAVSAVVNIFSLFSKWIPRFQAKGGTSREDLALQNIQARLRMVIAFSFSQLLPWFRGKDGFLLVLASANVDETLRGYMTKYDCSSGDINPIGTFNKSDVYRVLKWGSKHLGYLTLAEVASATPTAELRPLMNGKTAQIDEDEMKMSYAELEVYGRLRRDDRCGPVSMFRRLLGDWSDRLSPSEIAEKVKTFFIYYAMNRHKTTTLTPSYHARSYAVDDRRRDHRPFLYNTKWTWQFRQIDEMVQKMESKNA